jgi:serine/threonine protein kinase/TolB-like protein/Flp pilus assembly protein TadD
VDSTQIPSKFGDFEIARREDGCLWELGHGGMGVTYRARDSVLHRSVALKVIEVPPGAGHSAVVRKRFLREARAAAALRHPNVAAVYHFGMMPQPDRCYYAMELVEGETLEARLRREGPLKVTQVLDIGVQVTRALIAAANQGLIHRDLKPGNIMLSRSEDSSAGFEVKVIDFGLAKVIADAGGELDLTQGQFVGTPKFASPEQFESGPVDVRSDIYSLGATLWFALTGKPPFPGCKIEEIRVAQKSNALSIEQLKAAHVPPSLKSLLQSMLAFEPAARPGIQDLATQLRRCSALAEIEMASDVKEEIQLEIAHVLFIDIVGYSKLSINEQHAAVDELTQIVRTTELFRKAEAADRLIKLPFGDGMALAFYTSPDAPVRCAVQITRALREHPRVRVRMGIHSGPVRGVVDVTGRPNLAGAGLNLAQRVMECGDAGHILLSKHVAEDLSEFDEWRPFLHELGTCEVKHGVQIAVVNLWSDEVGNPNPPEKFKKPTAATPVVLPPTPPDPLGRKTLAVLPIEDLHPDPENSWFADGLTQELINVLSQIERLRVRDRKSVKNYDTTGKSAQRMADELGVQYLLEGTVRILNKQIRITVELIDAVEGDHLWSQTFKGTMEDIFEIQEQLALEIADALKISLTLEERSSVGQRMTANMEAYQRFVRAEEAMINQSPAAYQRAEHLLKEAVVLDPTFANAWALLAGIHVDLYWLYTRDEELPVSAEREARTALLHDQDSALAHVQVGLVTAHRGDRAEALKLAHEALRLGPNDGVIQLWRGHIYAALGDIDRGIETWEYAARLSPDNLMVLWTLAFNYALWNEHKYLHAHAVKSLPFLERYVFLHPDDRSIRGEYIVSLAAAGRIEEACRIAENLWAEPSDEAALLGGIAITFLLAGDLEQAMAVCERLSNLGVGLYMLLTPLFRKLRHHPKYRDLLKRTRSKFARGCAPPSLTRFGSSQQFVHRR